MAFGLNRAEVIGRLGADVTVNHLTSGGRVANLSIATDEGYIDKQTGDRVDKTEWHRVVTFQPGLVDMFEKHATKGPAGLCGGQAADPSLEEGRRGLRPVLDRDPAGSGRARAVPRQAQRQRRAGRGGGDAVRRSAHRRHPVLSAHSVSSLYLGRRFARRPFFLLPVPRQRPFGPRASAARGASSSGAGRRRRPAGIGPSPSIQRRPVMPPPSSRSASPAADIAAALGARAEAVCRRYLPQGKKQGRYWVAGDLEGARGRSLFVRLHGPGVPGKWTDAATGEHGDLLDLVRHRSGAPTLRAALAEARAFLALPAPPAPGEGYDATEAARRLWRGCRAIGGTHAEAYLHARGLARCRFPALRFHPELRYREGSSLRRFPALVAAVTGDDGAIQGVQRTWLDSRLPAKADVAAPRKALGRIHGRAVCFGKPADGASLLVGEGIETVLSIVTAAPGVISAAALSAGSLGAFAPPGGLKRLVIARDNDSEGERAAQRLARRCARAGVAAHVIVSEYGDFNDDLVTLGPRALALRLAALFPAPQRVGERE